jgi:hypothetical protein
MEEKSYTGSCHCGAVKFNVRTNLTPVIACNCSMCQRAGTWLTFVNPSQFELVSGEESLSNYHFNRHVIDHLFCKNCGIKPFARGKKQDGSPMVAINVRCLEDLDLAGISPAMFDGRSA